MPAPMTTTRALLGTVATALLLTADDAVLRMLQLTRVRSVQPPAEAVRDLAGRGVEQQRQDRVLDALVVEPERRARHAAARRSTSPCALRIGAATAVSPTSSSSTAFA